MAYTFSIISGALPTGLSLNSAGALTGTPTVSGTSTFTVQVADSLGGTATKAYTIQTLSNRPSSSSGQPAIGQGGYGYINLQIGRADYLTGAQTGGQIQTGGTQLANVVVASSANPSTNGDSVTFTAAVAPAVGGLSGSPIPAGTVTFSIDGVNHTVTLVSGIATYATTLATGTHTVTVTYNGSGAFIGGTSGTYTQSVNSSFTAPWQPPGKNVLTDFGANNLAGDGSTNDSIKYQNIVGTLVGGEVLYMPHTTNGYLLNGANGVDELQFLQFNTPPATFTLTVNNTSGSPVTTGSITYSATPATLASRIQSALDATTGVGVNGIVCTVDPDGSSMDLTYSGTGYTGTPQPLAVVSGGGSNLVRLTSGGSVNFAALKAITIIGDVNASGPSTLVKSTLANLTLFNFGGAQSGSFVIKNLSMLTKVSGSTFGAVCANSSNSNNSTVENCWFSGYAGWYSNADFLLAFRTCQFNGIASSTIGLQVAGDAILIANCDFNNWTTGIGGITGLFSSGFGLYNCTFETCVTGMNYNAGDAVANNLTFTGCTTPITGQPGTLSNVTITGTVGTYSMNFPGILTNGAVFNHIHADKSAFFSGCTNVVLYDVTPAYTDGGGNTGFVTGSTVPAPDLSDVDNYTSYVAILADWTIVTVTTATPALVADSSTDNTTNWNTLIEAARISGNPTLFYFPGSTSYYKVNGTVELKSLPAWAIAGDAHSRGGDTSGTTIRSTNDLGLISAAYAPNSGGAFSIDGLNLFAVAINITNPIFSNLTRCQITTGAAIAAAVHLDNAFECSIRSVSCIATNTAFLLSNCQKVTLENIDPSTSGIGVQANGTGLSIYASRCETATAIAFKLGYDASGNPSTLTNSTILGVQMEGDVIGIQANGCSGCLFAGVGILSELAHGSTKGFTFIGCSNCRISSSQVSGDCSVGGITVDAACSNLSFDLVGASNINGYQWSIAGGATGITGVNCSGTGHP